MVTEVSNTVISGLTPSTSSTKELKTKANVSQAQGVNLPQQRQNLPAMQDVAKKSETVDLGKVVSDLNNFVQSVRRELEFSIDEHSGHTVITVINAETEEIIRQIPPEEVIALAEAMQDDRSVLLKVKV